MEATAGEVYLERYVEQQSVRKMKCPSFGHKDLQCQQDAVPIAVCGSVPFVTFLIRVCAQSFVHISCSV